MKAPADPEPNDAPHVHAARVSIRIGKRTTFDASVTTAGLLSVGALVSSILLSSAVIVAAAGRRPGRRSRALPELAQPDG